MTFPTRPHAIFSTLQGTQNPDTKPTLQRAKNANAQPTTPADGILLGLIAKHQARIVAKKDILLLPMLYSIPCIDYNSLNSSK
jgi:hypothetical protein